jgi:hypothetical protein
VARARNGTRGDTSTFGRPLGTTASGAADGHARLMGGYPDSSELRVGRMGRERGSESLCP